MQIFNQIGYLIDKKTKRYTVLLFFMIVLSSAAELLGITVILPVVELAMGQEGRYTLFLSDLIRKYTSAESKEQVLFWMIGITIFIYVVKSLYVCLVYNRQLNYAATVKRDMANKLMKAYMKQPYSFFLNKNSSELIRGVNNDSCQIFQLISALLSLFAYAFTVVCIVIYLAATNLLMTLMVAGILFICLIIIIFVIQKKNRRNGVANQQTAGFLIKHLQQAFEGVKEIKLSNIEDSFIDTYDRALKKGVNLEVKYLTFSQVPKYLIELFAVSAVLVYLALVIAFDPNYIELLPQLAVFCVAAFKLLPSVNAMYAAINAVVYYKASLDLVYRDVREADSLEIQPESANETGPELKFKDKITVEGVSFKYEGADRIILDHVDFKIPRGKSVALIGPSGGGKTTTADLILGLLSPSEGCIRVDGTDIASNMQGWRRKLGYIPQTIYLTDDSIRKNIAFGIPEDKIDDALVWKALNEAQLKEFVEALPHKLDTMVGERGIRISGGQRQRIGIARALYRNPEVLVFDEATSALDNETEKEVMKAVDSLAGTKTILMIAHRLSTIENCDIIYKVEDGNVTIRKE